MIRRATQGKAWKDLMKVHSKVLIPSPLESSLTNRMTRNKRKKLTEIMSLPGCNKNSLEKLISEIIFHTMNKSITKKEDEIL